MKNMLEILSASKVDKKKIAEFLKTTPAALDEFEKSYQIASMKEAEESDNFFDINSRQAVSKLTQRPSETSQKVEQLTQRIVNELLAKTDNKYLTDGNTRAVTMEDIESVPKELQPQVAGNLIKVDIDKPSYLLAFDLLRKYKKTGDMNAYHLFRQGLDILDLDPILYEAIGMNPNSIGYWFPALKNAVDNQDFFKVPETKIIKVPLPILQLTRCNFMELTPTTIDIVNRWAYKAF